MKKITFLDRVIALVKGDDATAKAAKIQKKAKSLLKIEISRLENQILKQEDVISDCREAYEDSVMNNGSTDFGDDYVEVLTEKYNAWKEAEDELARMNEALDFYKEVLADVSGESSEKAFEKETE